MQRNTLKVFQWKKLTISYVLLKFEYGQARYLDVLCGRQSLLSDRWKVQPERKKERKKLKRDYLENEAKKKKVFKRKLLSKFGLT